MSVSPIPSSLSPAKRESQSHRILRVIFKRRKLRLSTHLLSRLFMNDEKAEYEGSGDDVDGNEEDLDQITDISLSEFLKKQEEIQSSKSSLSSRGKRGGIRGRVKRWLNFNRNGEPTDGNGEERDESDGTDGDEINLASEKENKKNQRSPPVQPIKLDGSTYDEEDLLDEMIMNDGEIDELEGLDSDVRRRAKKMREYQKQKRLQKIMEELRIQIENSPDVIVKNTKDVSADSIKNEDKKKVVRPNFDELLKGVPGIDDLLGDSTSDSSKSKSISNENSPTVDNDGNDKNDKMPYLSKDGTIIYDSYNSSEDSVVDSKDFDDDEEDTPIASENFFKMEQEMRKKADLLSRKEKNEEDYSNLDTPVKSREEINADALDSLEHLRRMRWGKKYIESDDIKVAREMSKSTIDDDSDSDIKNIDIKEGCDTDEIMFRQMEQDMRKKVGLTSRLDKEKDEPEIPKKNKNEDTSIKAANEIRTKLSSDALSTLESLRRKKMGDDYTKLDKDEIMKKIQDIAEEEEKGISADSQDDDTFLGDDEIASWDEKDSTFDSTYTEISSFGDGKSAGNDNVDVRKKTGFDLFTKKASTSDQIYRSIAAKTGGSTDDTTRSDWEAFLEKEQEMREKMGMTEYNTKSDLIENKDSKKVNPPKTDFFSDESIEGNEVSNVDMFEDKEMEKFDEQILYLDQKENPSLSSQIYRSIVAKKGVRDLGTEADFQAYFEKEAEMREKMGLAGSSEEFDNEGNKETNIEHENYVKEGTTKDEDDFRNLDLTFPSNPYFQNISDNQFRSDSSFEEWTRTKASSLGMKEQDTDEDLFESDVSEDVLDWIRFKEKTIKETQKLNTENQVYDETVGNQGIPNTPFFQDDVDDESEDDISDDVNDWIRQKEKSLEDKEKSSYEIETDEEISSKQDIPNTPFFENYLSDESQKDKTEEKDTYINSDPSVHSPKNPYDRRVLSDLFESSSSFEIDSYVDKKVIDPFSSYNARKRDLLETTELSVQDLNALGEFDPMAKLSMKLKPDSAFGSIFRLEGTLVDTTEMHMEAWTMVAEKHGFAPPSWEEVQRAQLIKGDEAVRSIFFWAFDIMESRDIALSHYDALQRIFGEWMERYENNDSNAVEPMFKVNEGAFEWLQQLRHVDMPCAVMSQLDRTKLDAILNVTHLDEFFREDRRVSSNCGYNLESQEMLGAALRLQRRPDHCVVFDTTPSSSVAAHDVDMKSVALLGLFAMYELNTADMTIPYFDELSVINIRRLFSDENFDEPVFELEKQKPERDRNPEMRTWAEGDRD